MEAAGVVILRVDDHRERSDFAPGGAAKSIGQQIPAIALPLMAAISSEPAQKLRRDQRIRTFSSQEELTNSDSVFSGPDLPGAELMTTATIGLAKGLEFRAVVVMVCDEGILPLDERVADAADEAELDEIYETEHRLLYVACRRAREHLLLTGVAPTSEYLADFTSGVG